MSASSSCLVPQQGSAGPPRKIYVPKVLREKRQRLAEAQETVIHRAVYTKDEAQHHMQEVLTHVSWTNLYGRRVAYGIYKNQNILNSQVKEIVAKVLSLLKIDKARLSQVYANYYRNGAVGCGRHRHPSTLQILVSLGATRTLRISDAQGQTLKDEVLHSGDVILFGSQYHELLKDVTTEPRVSLAIFVKPC